MSLPAAFSNNTSPTGGQLDSNFAAVAAMGVTETTATGTNALVLTINANQPDIGSYVSNQRFGFTALNSTTGAVTAQVGLLAPLPVYTVAGVQGGNGTISSGIYYELVYLASLNSGGGGFQITSPIAASVATPYSVGSSRGLKVFNGLSVPNTSVTITAGAAIVVKTDGTPLFISAPSVTIDLTTTGVNGMDSGSRPTNAFVYCYLISNGSVTAGLATVTSPAAGSPTLPGGYTYALYVGAMWCDGSQNLFRSSQSGNVAHYVVTAATNTAALPSIGVGVNGTYSVTAPSWQAVTLLHIPPTAITVKIVVGTSWGGGTNSKVQLAPNSSYGGFQNTLNNLPPFDTATVYTGTVLVDMEIESTTIYWTSTQAGGSLLEFGWTDYWVK